jgi:hypothetical protein
MCSMQSNVEFANLRRSSSETLILTRATRLHVPEDAILHSHRRKNLKSYTAKDQFVSVDGAVLSVNSPVLRVHLWLSSR